MRAFVHAICPTSVFLNRRDFGLRQLVVITLDEKLDKALPPQIEAFPIRAIAKELKIEQVLSKDFMWQFRIELADALLKARVPLLFNDLDAIWIKDPLKFIIDRLPRNVHIAAARASSPREFLLEWGAAVGHSFVYFRPSESSIKFLDTVKSHWLPASGVPSSLPPIPADWINHALRRVDIGWPKAQIENRDHTPGESRTVIGKSSGFGLHVALLDPLEVSTSVCRKVPGEREHIKYDVVVERCRIKNTTSSAGKVAMLKIRKTWLLKHHWRKRNISHLLFKSGNSTRESAWKEILYNVVNTSIWSPQDSKSQKEIDALDNMYRPRKPRPNSKKKKRKYPTHVLEGLVKRAKKLDGPIIIVHASWNYLVSHAPRSS